MGRLTDGMSATLNPPRVGPSCCLKPRLRSANPLVKPGGGVVVDEVVRGGEAKLGFFCDAESDGCFGEIKGALACVAGLLKSVLELQASAGDDDAGTGDLRPICGNGGGNGLCVGAAWLGLRLESEGSCDDGT